MGILSPASSGGTLLGFKVTLVLLLLGFCYCHEKSVEVIGIGECSDCAQNNIENKHAVSGLHIAIDCKVADGLFKTRGVGQLDEEGKFKVVLPTEIVKDNGELKEECFAQLHSASSIPCSTNNGLEALKIVFKSKDNKKITFNPTGKLVFSPKTCVSAFFWPYHKYPPLPKLPPFPKVHPWFNKPFPKIFNFPPHPPLVFPPFHTPPVPTYKPPVINPQSPPPPVYKPPVSTESPPPPVPIYKPPVSIKPPPVPTYKPPVQKKPCPPPVPKYKPPPAPKKSCSPSVPKNKPPVVVTKPPPVPVLPPPVPTFKPPVVTKPPPVPVLPPPVPTYKPPVVTKPPPVPVLPPPVPTYKPPVYTKPPCPPLPKFPPFPKYSHPKFGHHWTPLPPYSPHP